MTRQTTLAQTVLASARPVRMALEQFTEDDRARQAPNLPNHAAWVLGHCALTMHRVCEKLDGEPFPEDDFVTGNGESGADDRFDTESVCYGSTPGEDPALYPNLERATSIFESAIERLMQASECATDDQLDQTTTWGPNEIAHSALIARVSIHNGVHAGQLMDLRRALGMARLF